MKKNGTKVAVSHSHPGGSGPGVNGTTSIFFRDKVAIDSTFEFCIGADPWTGEEKIDENWLQYGFQIYGPSYKWLN